jgi:hypothetical protein
MVRKRRYFFRIGSQFGDKNHWEIGKLLFDETGNNISPFNMTIAISDRK